MESKVEVIEMRLMSGDKPLKAFCDVQIGTWTVRDFRIVKQNGQKAIVSYPQVNWKDPESGEIKYQAILTIPSEEKQRIDVAILSAYQRELEKLNGNPT